MTAIWIAGGILLCLCALALVPVRIEAGYAHGVFTITGRAGPVPVKLFPKEQATGRQLERDSRRDVKALLRKLPLPVLRLLAQSACCPLGWLLGRTRVRTLRVRYLAGGADPCAAAMAYARAGIAMEGVARMVPDADLRAEVDFDGARSALEGEIVLRARFGQAVYAAACFGMAFLRGYYQYQREKE